MRTLELSTPEELCALLGSRCRQLRLERNLSQADLAAMTGSSLSSIRRLESHGQGTLLLLTRIAHALQVVHQFDSFLVVPLIRIEEFERQEMLARRQRAGKPRPKRSGP